MSEPVIDPRDRLLGLLNTLQILEPGWWIWLGSDGVIPDHATGAVVHMAAQQCVPVRVTISGEPPRMMRLGQIMAPPQPRSLTWESIERWAGYAFEMLGRFVPEPVGDVSWPSIRLASSNHHATETVQLWWQQATVGLSGPPSTTLLWRPDMEAPSIVLTARGPAEREQCLHAVELLEHLQQTGRESERRQLAEAAARILELGLKLDRASLAAEFFIEPSSLDDRMRRVGTSMRAIRATPLAELKLGRISRK